MNTIRSKILFFYIWAGSAYDPKKETRRRGRYNGAKALADAEARMIDSGVLVASWDIDPDIMSDDWITADDNFNYGFSNPWHTYQLAVINSRNSNDCPQYLGGIDFGRNGSPGDDNYARVCVATLALAYIAEADAELEEDHVNALDIEQGCKDMRTVLDAAKQYASLTVIQKRLPVLSAEILAAVKRIRLC